MKGTCRAARPRQRAAADLEQLGEAAAPALRQALARDLSAEARRRVQQLLRKGQELVPSGEPLRALRAVEVLEQVGTSEARRVLQSLARGAPEARLTGEAKRARERLAGRQAADR